MSFGTKYSILNLVDLAGSERLSESGSGNIRETNSINKSLLTLTKVIFKLSEKKPIHIPYRESKLTIILQSAIGGNSLTALVAAVSPNVDHV